MSSGKSFDGLNFEEFRILATDETLSKYERIGFPDSYRAGFEDLIFTDIRQKLSNLNDTEKSVLDIGPGCSDLPHKLIDLCGKHQHSLALIDSTEMLAHLPDLPFIKKIEALFPDCHTFNVESQQKFDVILCYSVLHYALVDTAFFRFLDISLSLLAPGGQFLLGDIPNISKRKRFFSSEAGIHHHKRFMGTDTPPEALFNRIEHDQIDDAIVFAILQRSRAAGFDSYVIPQTINLPLANRREDILIIKP